MVSAFPLLLIFAGFVLTATALFGLNALALFIGLASLLIVLGA